MSSRLVRAAKKSLNESQDGAKVYLGQIATGDQFIRTAKQTRAIRSAFKGTLCVEMEGAAVAQVCHEYGVKFGVVRVISDEANQKSVVDFGRFVKEIASEYSYRILQSYILQK